MRKEIILLLLGVLLNGSLHAQEYKFEVGGMAGGAFYMGDTNKKVPHTTVMNTAGTSVRTNDFFSCTR